MYMFTEPLKQKTSVEIVRVFSKIMGKPEQLGHRILKLGDKLFLGKMEIFVYSVYSRELKQVFAKEQYAP